MDIDKVIEKYLDAEILSEITPPGWEGTVKAMKKNSDVDNPWALTWWMKNQGYKSRKKPPKKEED